MWLVLVSAAIVGLVSAGSCYTLTARAELGLEQAELLVADGVRDDWLELSPIMSGEIRDPRRTIFRATWISAALVTLFYVLGTPRSLPS